MSAAAVAQYTEQRAAILQQRAQKKKEVGEMLVRDCRENEDLRYAVQYPPTLQPVFKACATGHFPIVGYAAQPELYEEMHTAFTTHKQAAKVVADRHNARVNRVDGDSTPSPEDEDDEEPDLNPLHQGLPRPLNALWRCIDTCLSEEILTTSRYACRGTAVRTPLERVEASD